MINDVIQNFSRISSGNILFVQFNFLSTPGKTEFIKF